MSKAGVIGECEEGTVNLRFRDEKTLNDKVFSALARRDFLRFGAAGAVMLTVNGGGKSFAAPKAAVSHGKKRAPSDFKEVSGGADARLHVAEGYVADILLRWGDPLTPTLGAFNPYAQSPEEQEKRFGYNNDFTALFPLPRDAKNPDRMLLCVNHEYPISALMFNAPEGEGGAYSKKQIDIAMSALGVTVAEIKRDGKGGFSPVIESPYNRRISFRTTAIDISGPARGHARMRTKDDPKGETVIGTVQNCAGGVTPWDSYLTCEENINYVFSTRTPEKISDEEMKKLRRFDFGGKPQGLSEHYDRFDPAKEPNEPNRFGWVVEIDPYDPTATPVKRTALGRFKHEGCTCVLAKDGRLVAYMGDDQHFEYVYKFVSARPYDRLNRENNRNLLDEGVLHVAVFEENGGVIWKPLAFGNGPLTPENGFHSQADILIDARQAGDLLQATPTDRPEDIEVDPLTGKVYVSFTMNEKREQTNPVSPRPKNVHGQILEITPENDDHASSSGVWNMLLLGGPAAEGGTPDDETTADGTLSCPDNLAFDAFGRLWVATDQGKNWHEKSGSTDGLFTVETSGEKRGKSRRFLRAPIGSEVTGVTFTPDVKNLFVSIQHPGGDGCENWEEFARESCFSDPATRWPDFKPDMPPRPSLVVIRRENGEAI